ncbi:MAG: methionyl-tRNA formyltransferase [Anaerolineae bacterium]|nr:methionyl-tRNA formyltransferase [Anaerolineae bacterium]
MPTMSKVVFMGTPDFSVPSLKALIETQDVVGVVTQPDRPAGRGQQLKPSPVKVVAEAAGIPVYQPKSLRKEAAAEPLHVWNPDVIIVAAFGQILRPHVLDLPPHGCLNIHASLLPRWRGASPIQHAIMAGDAETGVCLMQMDVGLDTGAVYTCRATPISASDTAASLHDRLAEIGADLTREFLDDILAGKLTAQAQDDTLSTYAPMIDKENGRLDWTKSAAELDRQIRAMTPWPGAFTTWQGSPLKIISAIPSDRATSAPPGFVLYHAEERQTIVATGSGSLILETIQLAGKKAMSAADFVRGRTEFAGSQLGELT